MAASDSNHHYKIYISTVPSNTCKVDQSLQFRFNVSMSYLPAEKTIDETIKTSLLVHTSCHPFEHPIDELTKDSISNMLADIRDRIPFSLGNLHWKKLVHYHDENYVPLMSTDDLATLLLEMSTEAISERKLCLTVFIKNEVVVSVDEFLAALKAKEVEEVLAQFQAMVRMQAEAEAQGYNVPRQAVEVMTKAIRRAGLGDSMRDALRLLRRRAIRESGRQAMVRWVPAAATSIQGLEKVTCNSEEQCTVCTEEMLVGSQLTRMPCFHVFHQHCIQMWLSTSHMCPLCRFKLPTS